MKEEVNKIEEIATVKSELLEDSFLEGLGLIKQIDTLAIIEKAQEAEVRSRARFQDTLYALLGSLIIVFQVISAFKLGIKITLLVDFILSSPAPVLILFSMNKKYKGGFINGFK